MSEREVMAEALYGVYRATVTDIDDPDDRGRVKVRLGDRQEAWAELATLLAGDGYGTWFRPDRDDEVLVAFEAGDPRHPYVVGALWSTGDRPPETREGAATVKTIRTSCGAKITIDDARCQIRVEAPGGIRLVTSGRIETAASQVAFDTGQLTVNAGSAEFTGVVRCETLIADNIVGPP